MTSEELLEHALAARERAYAPYSETTIGAALLTQEGTIVTGVNVENASYGLTICAERSAVASAVNAGHRRFRAIAIAGPQSCVVAPCGACRQVLHEFNPQLAVTYTTPQGTVQTTLDRLLPDAFTL